MNITHNNIIALILDAESRANLFKAIDSEKGREVKTINAIANAIHSLDFISESEMIRVKNILLCREEP